ncbi:MAG: glutathione S-transferase family protein [Thermaurantiacus tibetensis]|uniref:glutathione S-transferase family protein n=1 Tax=Thermaurantiacus tibetensis TaxID=2759035 RepID=UPI00188F3A16|nr:glutathione S-transferase family protein [Thermaurantiacus tibetensis]
MRLYDSLGPNPQVVRTFMAEKGIALERVPVDIMGAENRGEAFRAINPLGQLPALALDDGTVVTEVTAICELLEELHPEPPLLGRTPAERAETRMWLRRFDLLVIEPFTLGFRATVARDFFSPRLPLLSQAAGAEMLAHWADRLRVLDGLLAGRAFVCGDRFSLADIPLGCFLRFAPAAGVPLPEGLAFVPPWLERLDARGTFAA